MFNIPTLVVLTETENTGCTIWRLSVYTQRCTKTASGTAFSRSVEKAFFYWKGDTWFDTPVYSWGRNVNHHFLLSFLPITLLIAVTLQQRINTLWLHGVSSLREFTAIGSPVLNNSPNPRVLMAIRRAHRAASLGFVRLKWMLFSILWNVRAGKPRRFPCSCPKQHTAASSISSTLDIL